MQPIIDPNQITIIEYDTENPNPDHVYVAGVQFSLEGYGGCTIVIADKTDKVIIRSYRSNHVDNRHAEEEWIGNIFSKWKVTAWRFLSEPQQEGRFNSFRRHDNTPIYYNTRAAQIQEATGFDRAYLHRINSLQTDGGWYPDLIPILNNIRWDETKIADTRFRNALCDTRWFENARGGMTIRFPVKEASIVYAGLLACIEINKEYFEMVSPKHKIAF